MWSTEKEKKAATVAANTLNLWLGVALVSMLSALCGFQHFATIQCGKKCKNNQKSSAEGKKTNASFMSAQQP